MREWRVVFMDPQRSAPVDQKETVVEEGELGSDALKRFKKAKKDGKYKEREVYAMYILDKATEQEDVIAIAGNCSSVIRTRHAAWKKKRR